MNSSELDLDHLLKNVCTSSSSSKPDAIVLGCEDKEMQVPFQALRGDIYAVRMHSTLNQLRDVAYAYAKKQGFHEEESFHKYKFGALIALIHSELSEALEADRANRWSKDVGHPLDVWNMKEPFDHNVKARYENYVKGSVEEELADALIRIFDTAGFYGVDLDWHVAAKMEYNRSRPKKHGKKY